MRFRKELLVKKPEETSEKKFQVNSKTDVQENSSEDLKKTPSDSLNASPFKEASITNQDSVTQSMMKSLVSDSSSSLSNSEFLIDKFQEKSNSNEVRYRKV